MYNLYITGFQKDDIFSVPPTFKKKQIQTKKKRKEKLIQGASLWNAKNSHFTYEAGKKISLFTEPVFRT